MNKKPVKIDESIKIQSGHVTVVIKADPLEINLDPVALGLGPAEAIAKSISNDVRTRGGQASASTIRQRKRQGITSTTRWNSTGRLAREIHARLSGTAYDITIPADRLQDPGLLARFESEMLSRDPLADRSVVKAIEKTAADIVSTKRGR